MKCPINHETIDRLGVNAIKQRISYNLCALGKMEGKKVEIRPLKMATPNWVMGISMLSTGI